MGINKIKCFSSSNGLFTQIHLNFARMTTSQWHKKPKGFACRAEGPYAPKALWNKHIIHNQQKQYSKKNVSCMIFKLSISLSLNSDRVYSNYNMYMQYSI